MNFILQIIIAFLVGYLLGSLNGAQILHYAIQSRFPRHITRIGTRNAGTQNVWMNIGRGPALVVFAIDTLKGYVAVVFSFIVGLNAPFAFVGGIGAVAGHNWPIYFHFRGGRGVATLAGALLALDFYTAFAVTVISQFFTLIRRSGLMPFSLLIGISILTYSKWGMPIAALAALAAVLLIARRLHAGKLSLQNGQKRWQVIKNIIFYDRPGANPPSLREMFFPQRLGELAEEE